MIRSLRTAAACAGTLALLGGCMSMSGTGGKSEMTCAAPEGIPCQSVSGVYANALAGNLPRATAQPAQASNGAEPVGIAQPTAYRQPADASGEVGAIRSEPTVIRIWFAPWEDSDGDLHDDSRVYLQIDAGRWLIEHNRERIRDTFAPKTAARAVTAAPVAAAAPAPTAAPIAAPIAAGTAMQRLVPPSPPTPMVLPTAPQEPLQEGS